MRLLMRLRHVMAPILHAQGIYHHRDRFGGIFLRTRWQTRLILFLHARAMAGQRLANMPA